jgi:hypothetical protein
MVQKQISREVIMVSGLQALTGDHVSFRDVEARAQFRKAAQNHISAKLSRLLQRGNQIIHESALI